MGNFLQWTFICFLALGHHASSALESSIEVLKDNDEEEDEDEDEDNHSYGGENIIGVLASVGGLDIVTERF